MTAAPLSVVPTRIRRLAFALARAALAVLAVHHGALLVERLRDASIGEPAVALRWVLAALVLALAAFFRRRGLTILSGRSGLVFWLLVLLLHVGVAPIPTVGVRSENLLVALPLGLAAALAIALGATRRAARRIDPRRLGRTTRLRREPPPARRRGPVLALRFAPRPPPAL